MKRIFQFSLALALLFTAQLSYAQVKVSPKVGLNVSALDASLNDLKTEARTGWHAGVDFRMGDGIFFLNPGLQYQSYNTRLTTDLGQDDLTEFKEETSIQSLKAPLNLGLRLTGDNGLLGLHVKGGITPTYVLGVKEVDNINFDVDRLNRLTWGANMGVGIDFLFLTADLTYEKGLSEYFKDDTGKNNIVSLSVGLKF